MLNAFRYLSINIPKRGKLHVKRKLLRTREMLKVATLFRLTWPERREMLDMLNEQSLKTRELLKVASHFHST